MILNYIKLALKVLGRNKFYTAISLFGISFTLLILMLITALYDSQFGANAPLTNKDRMVFIDNIERSLARPDTTFLIDSTMLDDQLVFDTTMTFGENVVSSSVGSIGYYFLDQFLRDPERTAYTSIMSYGTTFDVFLDNGKTTIEAVYSDANYWKVFDFKLLHGRTFRKEEVENTTPVAVITPKTAAAFFGKVESALGQRLQLAEREFEVVGIVAKCNVANPYVAADIYLPISTNEGNWLDEDDYDGSCEIVYLANSASDITLIKEELLDRAGKALVPDPEQFNRQTVHPWSYGELFAANVVGGEDPQEDLSMLILVFSLLLSLFILLPTLNLMNLNVSRIMERGAEIGVRKAFGAHSSNILYQFVFENIIITFIGGLIGFVLALIVIYLINDAQAIPYVTLGFNGRVFVYSLFICLAFGLLSGLLPAWRVSRLQIAETLKANQL